MQKSQTGHSAHNCGFVHYSETAQSRIMEKTTNTYEISSRNTGIVSYIKGKKTSCLKWYVDTTFAVHSGFKSHTGATLTMVKDRNRICVTKTKTEHERQNRSELSRRR